MKKIAKRFLSLLPALLLCLPLLLTSFATTPAPEDESNDYTSLYVSDVDGDGQSDIKFLYDAYGKTSSDTVGTTLTDRLGNTLTIPSGISYGNDCLNFGGKKIDLTAFYNSSDDIYFDAVIKQNGGRPTSSGEMVMGPSGKIQIQTRNEVDEEGNRKPNTSPIDESYGVISGTYWTPGNWGTDTDWAKLKFLGAPIGEIYEIALSVDKTISDTASTYVLSYVRDCRTVKGPSASISYMNSEDSSLYFGSGFDVSYYAVRLYTKALSDIQVKQNHFADIAAYTKMNLTAFYALDENEREVLYELTASLSLSDKDLEAKVALALEDTFINALYVRDADGDGASDATLLWNAFDKTSSDTVSESAFKTAANATYGNGYLYNDAKELNLTDYLPNITYGDQTAQKDYTVEMVMSTHAPYQSGTGMAISGKNWYFGNFAASFYFRQSEHADYLAGNGPISIYVGYLGATNLNFNFNKSLKNFWLSATPLEVYTATGVFDLTLGETPDVSKDTITLGFYHNAEKLSIKTIVDNPVPYDASNKNDVLKIGLGMRMNYYAIRVYSVALTQDDMRQNHFADLISYYRPDNLSFLTELSPLGMRTVRDACASLVIGAEGTEASLKAAINDVYENEKGEIYLGEFFMDFEGYSIRMVGDRDLRVTYAIDLDYIADLPEYVKVLEMGVLRTDVSAEYGNQSMKKDGLTLSYVEKNAHAEKKAFYEAKDGAVLSDTHSVIFGCGTDMESYGRAQMVRGYITVELRGEVITLYENAASPRFGTTVSLVSLSAALFGENEYDVPALNPERVLSTVLEQAEESFDAFESEIAQAKDERQTAEQKVSSAKIDAELLMEELKVIAKEGVGATPDEIVALQAQAAALLANVKDIKADGQCAYPNLADKMTAVSAKAELFADLVVLAAEALDADDQIAARADAIKEAAEEEVIMQKAGFSTKLLRTKADVTDKIAVIEKVGARIAGGEFGEVKSLKVLAIGNSFSNNAMSQLYEIATAFGYEEVVLGNLYSGGCSLEKHANNAKTGGTYESYRKATSKTWRVYENSTTLDGLQDEDWDIITFQQVSHFAPKKSTLTDGNLDYLIEFVDQHKTNPNAKFYYHATWAYAVGHTHPNGSKVGFEYLNDQAEMDRLIAEGVEDAILTRSDIDGVIYAGVAVAEARKHFGSEFQLYTSPDGYHLNAKGCYVIGLAWFGTLTGEDISSATDVKNSFGGNAADLAAAVAAAQAGLDAAR